MSYTDGQENFIHGDDIWISAGLNVSPQPPKSYTEILIPEIMVLSVWSFGGD